MFKKSKAYKLAFLDEAFILKDELRAQRLQAEYLKTDLACQEYGIDSTIVIFGSTRICERKVALKRYQKALKNYEKNKKSKENGIMLKQASRLLEKVYYYDQAQELGNIIAKKMRSRKNKTHCYVVTGGGPGIMEAGNRGAFEAGAPTMGLNITLPMEQLPNRYITPELCFQFNYFGLRKLHFLMRAKALVSFPGGYGTLDELFEVLTLRQTKKIKKIPIILFGKEFWQRIFNFDTLLDEGMIAPEDLTLFKFADTAQEAWQIIEHFFKTGEF